MSAGARLAVLLLLGACAGRTTPGELFQLAPESAQHRAAQTRFFETPDETELLSASAAVLQDLGFQIEESVREVGLLRAAKERSAREYGQDITRFLLFLASFGSALVPVDLHQKISATLVTRPVDEGATRHEVRVAFYRLVWKGDGVVRAGDQVQQIPPGQQKMEMIRDPEIYQQFFAKLSKAVFLEAHRI